VENEKSPWMRAGFLSAAAFVVLVVVLLVVVLTSHGGTHDPQGVSAPVPTTTDSPAPASSPPTTEVGPTTVPTAPPDDVTWTLYRTVALPVSRTAGPRDTSDDSASGYAHTPTGALLAAANIPVRKLISPGWREIVEHQVVPGQGRDAFIAARSRVTDETPQPGQLGQIAGFRIVNYTANLATVQIVTRFVSAKIQLTTVTVSWDGGDWRLVLQPDGADSANAQALQSLTGFTEWGGV
jgi:hypothetical protein